MRCLCSKVHDAKSLITVIAALSFSTSAEGLVGLAVEGKGQNPNAGKVKELTLKECLITTLENIHRKPASLFAVVMAEARHRQVLSGY